MPYTGRPIGDVPICVDARMLGDGGTGVATYARSLASAIGRVGDRPCRLVACRNDDGRLAKLAGALRRAAQRLRVVRDDRGMVLEGRDVFRRAQVHFDIHRRLYPLRCDLDPGIMHWTYPVPMRMAGWINLYTIHDAIPLDRPDLTPIDSRRHRAILDAIVAGGDGITTVSQDARSAIVAALGCAPAFVADIGQPVDVGGFGIGEAVSGLLPPGLAVRGYFLVVGSVEPRKNLAAILAAYRSSGTAMPLVVAGPDGWRAAPILADIAATPGAIRIPYVGRAGLLTLIANARALVFPSLAEGFGLPLVEAMALGTPVLTSDRGALAEVAGGAALPVDPIHIGEIAHALARLAGDDTLVARLAERGKTRAAAFTMDRFVTRLAGVYADALRTSAGASNGRDIQARRR